MRISCTAHSYSFHAKGYDLSSQERFQPLLLATIHAVGPKQAQRVVQPLPTPPLPAEPLALQRPHQVEAAGQWASSSAASCSDARMRSKASDRFTTRPPERIAGAVPCLWIGPHGFACAASGASCARCRSWAGRPGFPATTCARTACSGIPVFQNRQGSRLSRWGVRHIPDKHVQAVRDARPGFTQQVTPHTLRNTKGTHLLQAGVSLQIARDFPGHEDVFTTPTCARAKLALKRTALQQVDRAARFPNLPSSEQDNIT